MQKNIIINKITPCCSLPFSVVYWWISNLTLNSESDRQFILSKISQNGTISIDGWKVLVNSGTLESDASLTKAEFLAWFNCGKQPNCEQLKLIIEGYKLGVWVGELNEIKFVDVLGNLKITDTAPTTKGIYILSDVGTYTNLGGLVTTTGKVNYAYFDGTTWSKVEVELNLLGENSILEPIRWDNGFYLVNTGQEAPASWMSTTNFLKVEPNTFYNLYKSADINYRSIFFYDIDKNFISTANTQIFKTPANAVYVRISKSSEETIVPHKLTTNISVSQTIDADFTDLLKAYAYANLTTQKCIIRIIGKINLTNTLVITTNHVFLGDSPKNSEIEFISNSELIKCTPSTFKNLTISRVAVTEGYCVHADYAGEGVVEFDNCIIKNNMGPAIGAGSHANQTLRFKNCEMYHLSKAKSFSPTLYWHNNVNNVPNQRLEIINSIVYSDYERPLQISDQNLNLGDGLNRDSLVTVINSRFHGALYGNDNLLIQLPVNIGNNTISGNIKINLISGGNNIPILNK